MKVYHAPVSLITDLRLSTQSYGSHYFPAPTNKRGTLLCHALPRRLSAHSFKTARWLPQSTTRSIVTARAWTVRLTGMASTQKRSTHSATFRILMRG
jgi:hypothetical protein